jgi:hypothetical protein
MDLICLKGQPNTSALDPGNASHSYMVLNYSGGLLLFLSTLCYLRGNL